MSFELIILPLLIFLSAIFSSIETALMSISQAKVRTFLSESRSGSKALNRLKDNPRRMIITILIGNNIVNIAAASLVAVFATERFGSFGLGIATGIMTVLILVFGEIIPKTFASTHASSIALLSAPWIEMLSIILLPVIFFLDKFSKALTGTFRPRNIESITGGEIKSFLQIAFEKNILDINEKTLMEKVLKFGRMTAIEVMTPINSAFSVDENNTIKDSLERISHSGYSRILVYRGKKNNISGVVLVKDILKNLNSGMKNTKLKTLKYSPLFISPLIHIDNLLNYFRNKQTHLALIKNGEKIIGVVTFEDLLEELVGDITDESEITPSRFVKINNNSILVHPDTPTHTIETFFHEKIGSRKNETISQSIKHHVTSPQKNSQIVIGKLYLTIEDITDDGSIRKVKIIRKDFTELLAENIKNVLR